MLFFYYQRDVDAAARKKVIDDAAAAKLRVTQAATAKVRDEIRWDEIG